MVVDVCFEVAEIMPSPYYPFMYMEEGTIHFFVGSHVKKPESGLFSDWIGNNTDDLRCSNWPLVVVDFSLHFCLRNELMSSEYTGEFVMKFLGGSVFLNLKNA